VALDVDEAGRDHLAAGVDALAGGAAASRPRGATRATRSPRSATSPQNHGLPVPSTTRALVITTS
jgi:hypothetical protein